MQCENTVQCLGSYFIKGERVNVRCTGEARWIVSVNPPSEKSDGKVRLCDHCNKFDYRVFPRVKILE